MPNQNQHQNDPPKREKQDIQGTYYRHLFDGAGFAIIGADCQGIIVSCNRAAEKMLDKDKSHILGHHIEEIVPNNRRKLLRRAIEQALTKRESTEFEIDHTPAHADEIRLAMVISPILDDSHQIMGLSAWARDITNRKVLQEQLSEAEQMAALGTLASGVAHHFNNIIGGVATFVDYALNSDSPQASRRALQMTAEAATRIGQLTESLLTYAEKDIRQFDLCDMTEVILTFGHLVEKPLKEKNIQLQLKLHAVPIYEIPGSRMHQVLGNLLDNAERAMPSGGTVTISMTRDENDLILHFSDTGVGIEPENIPHIFEPFFTTQGLTGGGNQPCAGLGLSVVQGVVRELGGSIEVASQVQKGTTFTLRFPLGKAKKENDTQWV